MTTRPTAHRDLPRLLEAVCENRLAAEDVTRLETILSESATARKEYREYLHLHGTLYWDTAVGFDSTAELPVYADRLQIASTPASQVQTTAVPTARKRAAWGVTTVALAAMGLLIAFFTFNGPGENQGTPVLVETDPAQNSAPRTPENAIPKTPRVQPDIPLVSNNTPPKKSTTPPEQPLVAETPQATVLADRGSSDETILEFVNTQLAESWTANEIAPSEYATESEWLRRVYLDLVGHIPSAPEADRFLADDNPRKRELLIDYLLSSPDYVQNWSTIWANLMVGRAPERPEFRDSLQKFLRDSVRENRPWDQIVAQIISAEGTVRDNAASGFLLAHVNNQAVPATAITARLFLGTNVQCTQCHDHPFNDARQNQFWELNSFFKQTARQELRQEDPATGRMLTEVALVTREDAEGPTFYENRQGLVRPAYPIYEGNKVSDDSQTNRRQALAELLSAGEKPQIAEAFVNRLWDHFLGCGFTSPVDDMGPHNPPSHPQLLDRLAREFVHAGYDQKRLMKWICLSDAYQRTSRVSDDNEFDRPDLGEIPLFSRVYPKSMTAEQVYDSLLVATGVIETLKGDWSQVESQRDEWLQQFVHAYANDENNEDTHFAGTISQALMMMNGDLIEQAVSYQDSTALGRIVNQNISDQEKIKQICLATLTRYPTPKEAAVIKKLISQSAGRNENRREATARGLQDVFWAYLNSSEFVLVH